MSGKKENLVDKRVAIALGIIVTLLFSGLIVVFAYFSAAVSLRDNIILTKDSEILNLESQIVTLQDQVSSLQNQVESQQNEILDLQNQLSGGTLASTAARVINVGVGARDENSPSEPYLYVSGYVCNVGSETAYNVKLHVTAYRDSVEVINGYYDIAELLVKEDSKYVEARFYYSGPALTFGSWTMTPEWT